jgi:hypothetical protein
MCIRWASVYDCGCEDLSHTECLIGKCPGIEVIQSKRTGRCRTCEQKEASPLSAMSVYPLTEVGSGKSVATMVDAVGPWLLSEGNGKPWTTATRRKADDAWEREHFTRMLVYHSQEVEILSPDDGQQAKSKSTRPRLPYPFSRTQSRDSGYSSLGSKQSSRKPSGCDDHVQSKAQQCPCRKPPRPTKLSGLDSPTTSAGTRRAAQAPDNRTEFHCDSHDNQTSSSCCEMCNEEEFDRFKRSSIPIMLATTSENFHDESVSDLVRFNTGPAIEGLRELRHVHRNERKLRNKVDDLEQRVASWKETSFMILTPADVVAFENDTQPIYNMEKSSALDNDGVTPADLKAKHESDGSLSRRIDSVKSLIALTERELSFLGLSKMVPSGDNSAPTYYNHATESFIEELVSRLLKLVNKHASDYRQAATQGSDRTSSRASSSSSRPPSGMTTGTSLLPGQQSGRGNSPDDGNAGRLPTLKRKFDEGEPGSRLFACPYAKFDPPRYSRENLSEPEYWSCGTCCLRNISRLKQHLYRVHSRPPYYCDRCFLSFKTREELAQHVRQEPPCDVQRGLPRYADRMTDTQFEGIKRRVMRGDPPEIWYSIFSILFPEAAKPASPYMTTADATAVNHFATLFRWFGAHEMMQMLQQRQSTGVMPLELPTQAVVDEAFEIAMSDYLRQTQVPQLVRTASDEQAISMADQSDEDGLLMAVPNVMMHGQHRDAAIQQSQAGFDDIHHQQDMGPSEHTLQQLPLSDSEDLHFGNHYYHPAEVQNAFDQYADLYNETSLHHGETWDFEETVRVQ